MKHSNVGIAISYLLYRRGAKCLHQLILAEAFSRYLHNVNTPPGLLCDNRRSLMFEIHSVYCIDL